MEGVELTEFRQRMSKRLGISEQVADLLIHEVNNNPDHLEEWYMVTKNTKDFIERIKEFNQGNSEDIVLLMVWEILDSFFSDKEILEMIDKLKFYVQNYQKKEAI